MKHKIPWLLAALLSISNASWGQGRTPANDRITIEEVRPIQVANGKSAQQVRISYSFPGTPVVYIDGFGQAGTSGVLSYITEQPNLVVRRTKEGPVLIDRPFRATGISMGSGTEINPEFKYFGGTTEGPILAEFPGIANRVLTDQFQLGPYIYVHNDTTYMETRYHRLLTADSNLIIEVAVQLSYPAEFTKSAAGFEVRYAVRERRKATEWLEKPSAEAEAAATEFMVSVNNKLKRKT